ncbi:hypothetical protein Bca52824_081577 [Brassica carinata]|uniref:Uncharacterized protein n=1 Tax=Brassica carinata TaxID=52824 RepID=A0A8X7PGM6_BRACI|nr:hypothetical protein Bca52824_081577 [Brassica carinata]
MADVTADFPLGFITMAEEAVDLRFGLACAEEAKVVLLVLRSLEMEEFREESKRRSGSRKVRRGRRVHRGRREEDQESFRRSPNLTKVGKSALRVIKGHFSPLGESVSRGGGIGDLAAVWRQILSSPGWLGSCSQRVSEHLVVLREALLRSGVGGDAAGFLSVLLPLPVWFGAVTGECVDLLLVVFIPVCAWSSLILATGFSFGSKDFLIFGSRRRQSTRVFRVSICQWGLWSLGGLVGDSGISQHREQDRFMVVSSHIVFAGLGMLSASTSSGRFEPIFSFFCLVERPSRALGPDGVAI